MCLGVCTWVRFHCRTHVGARADVRDTAHNAETRTCLPFPSVRSFALTSVSRDKRVFPAALVLLYEYNPTYISSGFRYNTRVIEHVE